MKNFVIIDGNSLVNRAYYALPPLTSSRGEPTQAVYGFMTMMIKAVTDFKPDYLAVAFDLPKPTFRHEKYNLYKANRHKMPDDLAAQLPMLKNLLGVMGIRILEKEGFEADDIIGTMAKKCGGITNIITGDRDALQLIDKNTFVLLTKKGLSEIRKMDEASLKTEFGLTPQQVIDYKALCGDASDNIPGVAGVGDKTATTLIQTYNNLDNVYQNIDNITGKLQEKLVSGKDSAYLSKMLATIHTGVDIEYCDTDCTFEFPFSGKVRLMFNDLGFKSLVKREDLFKSGTDKEEVQIATKPPCSIKSILDIKELEEILSQAGSKIAISFDDNINFAFSYSTEYSAKITMSLIEQGLDYTAAILAFKPILENPDIEKVLFDAKAVLKKAASFGIEVNNYNDVKLMQYLVDSTVSIENALNYYAAYGAGEGECATTLLYIVDELKTQIEKQNMRKLYYDVELPLTRILFKAEQRGFKVDLNRLSQLGSEFAMKQDETAKQIFAICQTEFNLNSPKQLAKVLFEDLKIPYPYKSKSYSTSADILERLEADYPIASKILEYRLYTKLNSTYVEGLKKVADFDGTVHTDFKQMLTSTGRLSSVEPNLQNIPVRQPEGRVLRSVFVSSGADRVLVCADYSQIELRLMAHFSHDAKMVETYLSGGDIHESTAAEVFGVEKNEVTKDMRRSAKAVNFGIIYGMSEYGLATNLGISTAKAKEYITKYFERFSGVKSYLDQSIKQAKEKGYALTILGRKRKFPELYSANYNIRQFAERAAVNMPLQGSAADIIKLAMIQVDKALEGLKSKLILQVHDELIVDTFEPETELVKQILRDKMCAAAKLIVPLTVEIGVGKNWLDCK